MKLSPDGLGKVAKLYTQDALVDHLRNVMDERGGYNRHNPEALLEALVDAGWTPPGGWIELPANDVQQPVQKLQRPTGHLQTTLWPGNILVCDGCGKMLGQTTREDEMLLLVEEHNRQER